MSAQKKIDEYEYSVKIHEVSEDGTVTLLFEETDGLDGFAVNIGKNELENLVSNGKFDEWCQQRVEERISLLKRVKEQEEKRKKLMEEIKPLADKIKGKKIKPKKVKTE